MTCRQLVSVVMKRTCVPINIWKMTVVSLTVHEIFNKHRLWVSQTQRECRCYKQSASSAGLNKLPWSICVWANVLPHQLSQDLIETGWVDDDAVWSDVSILFCFRTYLWLSVEYKRFELLVTGTHFLLWSYVPHFFLPKSIRESEFY